jgi:hypothetical protein
MYNLTSNELINEFSRDIATKIFWEADTITLNGSITASYIDANNKPGIGTLSGETTAEWSEINIFDFTQNNQLPLETARELLCELGKKSRNYHTFKATRSSISPRIQIVIYKSQFENEGISCAPFSMNFEGGLASNVGVQIFTRPWSSTSASEVGVANWITPWGNTTSKLFYSSLLENTTLISSSMTITVTAANPTVRYV